MKKWIDTKSLSFKLWTYFAIFAAAIMVILWLLQVVFLNTYYNAVKTKQLVNVGRQIAKEYGQSDFQQTMDEFSYRNSLMVFVADTAGRVYSISQVDSFDRMPLTPTIDNYSIFLDKLYQNSKHEICYTSENKRFNSQMLIYGTVVDQGGAEDKVLYISMPLEPVTSAVSVLQQQLIYVIVGVLIFSFIISYFISRRISSPITRISDAAKKLGTGDYNVVFEKANYAEIDELATTLNFATRELSKTDQLRRDLIANVSHDLRTPLTIVKSYAEMIRDISGDIPEKRSAHAQVIIDEADRLTGLVEDVLNLSKLQSMDLKPNLERVDFSAMVCGILKRFEFLVHTKGYTITSNVAPDLYVSADKAKIEQVVYNLISNAVNYTGEDQKIEVRLTVSEEKACFEVQDTGRGIPEEELPFIWDRYYKSSQSHKRYIVGTGLGLSIVKNILVMHNAAFGVRSVVNQGSTFWFQLPLISD